MRLTLSRMLRICAMVLLFLAVLLLVCSFTVDTASAETHDLGDKVIGLPLVYGDEPNYYRLRFSDDLYYEIISYRAKGEYGLEYDLLTNGRVSALPGKYEMSASSNTRACDAQGNPIGGHTFSGTIEITITGKTLPIKIKDEALSKLYGETGTIADSDWDYVNEEDRENHVSLTFSCNGFDEKAHAGSYRINTDTVMKGTEDVTSLYTVNSYTWDGTSEAELTVEPKPVVFSLPEHLTVSFNHWQDGESLTTCDAVGVNGETLRAYYRLSEEPQGVLTVGQKYPIEIYRYEVISLEGTTSYGAKDSSDYIFDSEGEVEAGKGTLTIYASEALMESRANDLSYLYYPTFIAQYLDADAIVDSEGRVPLELPYCDSTLKLKVEPGVPAGVLACGEYSLSLFSFEHPLLTGVSFEGGIKLRVSPRILVYDGQDEAEIASGDTFRKRVSLTYDDKDYLFDLTVDLEGKGLDTPPFAYDSCEPVTDNNFTLDLTAATVKLVKRKTGVIIAESCASSVIYGDSYLPFVLRVEETDLPDVELTFSYSRSSSSARLVGLPIQSGEYRIYASLAENAADLYEVTGEVSRALTIAPRPVAAHFILAKATIVYGDIFAFGEEKNVKLDALYDYNEETAEADRTSSLLSDQDTVYGSLKLSGAAATPNVGEYDIDFSAITVSNYRIVAAFYRDFTAGKEVEKFTVVQADAPKAPTPESVTASGREIRVTFPSPTSAKGEISLKSDYSGAKKETSSTGQLSFKQLTYGEKYYIRVSISDDNYREESPWTELTAALPFAKPEIVVSELRCDRVSVTLGTVKNAVADYVLQYRIGTSGEWKDGTEVVSLKADTQYKLCFRLKNDVTEGEVTQLSVRTLRAPVSEDDLSIGFDREKGVLAISTSEELEYRLLDESGEFISEEWSVLDDSLELAKDRVYTMQVRLVATDDALASDFAELTIDTHKVKVPFSLKRLLSVGFLLFVGGILLIATILMCIILIKAKRRAEKEELGG